jgi:uncharacterized protein DUF1360
MTLPVPNWWETTLLSLAAFRVYRLIARDTITEPVRVVLTYRDDESVALADDPADLNLEIPYGEAEQPKTWRVYLSTLIRCPWCMGFYVSVAWWAAWWAWPYASLFVAAPWAISAIVALLAKTDA